MRIFIAIDTPKKVQRELKKYYDNTAPVTWTSPENLHVTLNFLGEITEQELDSVLQITHGVAGEVPSFEIILQDLLVKKYMVWAGIKHNIALDMLEKKLRNYLELSEIGERQHHNFRPHINLARAPKGTSIPRLPIQDLSHIKFPVTHIVVFERQLRPEGPLYTSIDAFPLKPH